MTALRSLGLATLLVTFACGGVPPAPKEGTTDVPVGTSPSLPIATAPNCADPVPPPATARDKGIEALVGDRLGEAADRFSAAVAADPRDRAAKALLRFTRHKLQFQQSRIAAEQASLPQVSLSPIESAQNRALAGMPAAKVHLEKVSEAKNLITDDADWFVKNGLTPPPSRRAERTPADVPASFRNMPLRQVFVHADHVAAVYGQWIVVSSADKAPLVFDATQVGARSPRGFDIGFAELVGTTLLVELAYNGYANESGGKNGYVAAFDVASGAPVWVSPPLTSNAGDAVVSGGSVITGYGFTAEPDFLFVLDIATGRVDQKVALKSGPSAIRAKGDLVYVRTYDTDYVFKSTTGLAPAVAASLRPAARTETAPLDPETLCWVRRATASLSDRNADSLKQARLGLSRHAKGLEDLFAVEAVAIDNDEMDLTTAPLVVVPAPPWPAANLNTASPASPARKLIKVHSAKADPVRNMHPTYEPRMPYFIAPVDRGRLPPGARKDIPPSYGQEYLGAIIPDQERGADALLLIYGGRYLARVEGTKSERIFDLAAFMHPPKTDPRTHEFAVEDATYAQVRDNVLYVCNGGGSYAREVFGKKGYVSALDATTGALVWRSEALTCNATFAVAGDYLVTGYGFTDEPDFVFLVRRSDGRIVQKVPIDSAPETITLSGNRVHVESYGSVTELELR